MTNKALIFARVSTEEQDYQRQLVDLQLYASQNNLEVVGTITEKVSGTKSAKARKGLQELLKRAKAGEFHYLVVQEISRLGRNAFQVQSLIHALHQLKVCVLIQENGLRSLDPDGNENDLVGLMLDVAARFAQMENRNRAMRIRSGQAQAKRNGKHIGRKSGTCESDEALVRKYYLSHRGLIQDLKGGTSQKKAAKLHELSINTVRKVRQALERLDNEKEKCT
jgi:DNA invertase Pin-like site-specific DNA recombinase